ncbi:MAG: MFS transporter [Sulfolobales archaeon]
MTKESSVYEIALNLGALFYFLSLHSIAPYISRYAVSLGAGEYEVAMLGPTLSLIAITLRPISGSLIDRGLLRQLMILGIGLAIAAQAFYSISSNITLLYVGRGLQGMGVALFIPASVYSATLTSRNAASSLAWRSTMIGFSMSLGPAIGGFIVSTYGYRTLFTTTIVYLLISGLLNSLALRKLKTPERTRDGGQLKDLLSKDFLISSFAIVAYSILYNCFSLFLPAHHSALGVDVAVTTVLFTTISISNFASRIVLSIVMNRVKYSLTAALGFGLALLGITFIILSTTSPYLMIYAVIAGVGGGLLIPSLQVLALLSINARSRGLGSGVYTAMFDIGNVIGPPLAIALGGTYLGSLKISLVVSSLGFAVLVAYNVSYIVSKNLIKRTLN